MGCQKTIAREIHEADADSVLAPPPRSAASAPNKNRRLGSPLPLQAARNLMRLPCFNADFG